MPWTAADIPDLTGSRAIVTGANSGLGLVTAAQLAQHGADVVLAARDLAKGQAAIDGVAAGQVGGVDGTAAERLRLAELDLADLASVRAFAEAESGSPLDLLVNNAGVMAIPRRETADGFEMQLGTNHLGHFALTGLLMPALLEAPGARVVTVSSNAHKFGRMSFDDLMGHKRYSKWTVYGQSKLANLLFMYELQRKADAANKDLLSLAAHPGLAATNLSAVGPQMEQSRLTGVITGATGLLGQSAEMGALPQLYAATAPDVHRAAYYGPASFFEQRGYPKLVRTTSAARDPRDAARLWDLSEELTGVHYEALDPFN